jgi:hypothetical protein
MRAHNDKKTEFLPHIERKLSAGRRSRVCAVRQVDTTGSVCGLNVHACQVDPVAVVCAVVHVDVATSVATCIAGVESPFEN